MGVGAVVAGLLLLPVEEVAVVVLMFLAACWLGLVLVRAGARGMVGRSV